ncbi:MAG: FAD-dependent oxidoreductase [Candidatus Omnitrophica bacterium]|nr:FAD-dependent oxidoreductase [Candidatus Omnitrophota bacterium]
MGMKKVSSASFDVIVLGSGAAGLGAADAFASRGLRTAVMAPSSVSGAASPRAAGILDPLLEQNQQSPLIPAAIEAFRRFPEFLERLKKSTGSDALYRQTGMLYLSSNPFERRELERRFKWQKKWMPSLELLSKSQVLERFPNVHPKILSGLFYPEVGKINAPEFLRIFKKHLKKNGVHFLEDLKPPRIKSGLPGKGVQVGFRGRVWNARFVVNAAGAWAGQKGLSAKRLSVKPVRGQMLVLKAQRSHSVILHSLSGGYLVPWEKGIHLAGSTVEYAGYRDRVTVEGRKGILKRISKVCPEVLEMKEVGCWAGLRPRSGGGMPLLGPVPGQPCVYAATGYFRSGILLSSFFGGLLADSIMLGKVSPLMKPFLPADSGKKFSRSHSEHGGQGS